MIIQTKSGAAIITGTVCKEDAKLSTIGQKGTKKYSFCVKSTYRQEDGQYHSDFINCSVIGRDADKQPVLCRDDHVLVCGQMKSREYNGKTYTELDADFIIPQSLTHAPDSQTPAFPSQPDFSELGDGDGELPF